LRALLLLAALAVAGCHNPVPQEAPPKAEAKVADLDALASLRSSSSGAELEAAQAAARSERADKVYAAGEGEPSLVELEDKDGKPPAGLDLPSRSASSGPSDLDKADDLVGANIDMDGVSGAIRNNQRRLNTCWEDLGPGGNGTVLMRITIGRSGDGAAKLAPGSTVRSPELARCLTSALERTDFPEPSGGAVSFEYPLRF